MVKKDQKQATEQTVATAAEETETVTVEEQTTPSSKRQRGSSRRSKLEKENEQLKQQLADLQDRYLRTLAEFDNFRKRSEREFAYVVQSANAELIKQLLPIVDDLERSLEAAKQSKNFEALYEGIELVYQNFFKVLESFGVQPIEAVGQPFDPEVHEALMQMESEHEPDTVVQEHQKGYRLRDRVLRPSKVIVSR